MRTIRKRQYEHNFSFFDEPNMINTYWAGFIAADGYLNDERKCLRLLVARKDKKILYGSRVNFLQYQVNLLDLPVLKRKWK